ncbi:MAG: anhydro-N-acetylmuramic acid kinase [Bacteroidia bacterium]|nr:MAG: anhydro-N-acetylmuramic acid kinase [Bacteroidia bacterium]
MGKRKILNLSSLPSLKIIGVMSGSSMDGLDVALCEFTLINKTFQYKIIQAKTFAYPPSIKQLLLNIRTTTLLNFFESNVIYAQWMGKKINHWLSQNKLQAHAISIHGHTVFHHPEKGFSIQLGDPHHLAAITQLPVIHNFRNLDIALGGQGAPLVPIGDKLLFPQYDACLNIGGIANIYIQKKQLAYDICIANMALNYFAQKLNKNYDYNGNLARKGKINRSLLSALNHLKYFQQKPPKSLNREYFENHYLPLFKKHKLSNYDYLSTLTEHIAIQISQSINLTNIQNVLITGGGSLNKYLIDRIEFYSNKKIIISDKTIVKFKEALIFALLGYLRIKELPNTIPSATGASQSASCGEIVIV